MFFSKFVLIVYAFFYVILNITYYQGNYYCNKYFLNNIKFYFIKPYNIILIDDLIINNKAHYLFFIFLIDVHFELFFKFTGHSFI